MLGAVRQQVLPALEALDEIGVPPRRNQLQPGVEGLAAHLEPDLFVALPRRPVHDEAGVLGLRDPDHLLRDARAGHGRPQQVLGLVRRRTSRCTCRRRRTRP